MLRRLIALVVLALVPAVLAGLPQRAAQADPSPGFDPWPRCVAYASAHSLTTVDTDNLDCVVSFEKNTGSGWVDVPPVDYGTPNVYDDPYVDTALGAGTVRFGVYETTVPPSGSPTLSGNVDPDTLWRFTVNVGTIHLRELYGVTRQTDFSVSGGGASGNVLLLTFRPSPVAWLDGTPGHVCEPGSCGDATTVADYSYDGFVTGYVTDLEFGDWTAADRVDRNGMINSWNANYGGTPIYNSTLNSLDIQLANPHLVSTTPDVVATGYYESFLPNAYLTNVMQVPDPSSLSSGTITVSRVGSSTTVPFTLTHEAGGIRIVIDSITFSSPKFRIKPDPTAPGKPRWGSVTRATPTKVKLAFRRPLADGGPNITSYQGRCRRGTAPWTSARASASPIFISGLPRRSVDCQVRAQNRIGWGHWSTVRSG